MPKNRKLSAAGQKEIEKRLIRRYEALRKKYPEVHGKVVDFISHSVEDGTLYFTVRFTDKTAFSL
jgi:Iap family predicted aminopeptidase